MLSQYNSRVTPLTCVGLSLMHAFNQMRYGRFLDSFILFMHNSASKFTARVCPLKLIALLFEICDMKLLYLQLVIILYIHASRSSNSFTHPIMNACEQQYGFPEWKQELQNYNWAQETLAEGNNLCAFASAVLLTYAYPSLSRWMKEANQLLHGNNDFDGINYLKSQKLSKLFEMVILPLSLLSFMSKKPNRYFRKSLCSTQCACSWAEVQVSV